MKPKWAQVPAARTSGPLLKIRFWLLIGTVAAAMLAGLMALPVALQAQQVAASTPDVTTVVPQARGFAERVVASWLDGDDLSAFPAAAGLSGPLAGNGLTGASGAAWDRFDRHPDGSFVSGGVPYEVHHFTVTVNGRRWQLSVLVLLTGDGPAIGAPLSALPVATVDGGQLEAADLSSVEVEGDVGRARVTERLGEWATAYAADDRAELQELAGDTRSGVTYLGLGGYTVDSVRLLGAFPATIEQGRVVVGRVRIAMVEPAAADGEDASSEEDADLFTVDLDVLVAEFDTQLPKVIAWGPAGSAASLEPFHNAVVTDR